jgi:hypothetical protein
MTTRFGTETSGRRTHDVQKNSLAMTMYGSALFKFRLTGALPSDAAIHSVSHPRSVRRWRSAGRFNPSTPIEDGSAQKLRPALGAPIYGDGLQPD